MSLTLVYEEKVAHLRFDDGKRNVFSLESIEALQTALDEVEASAKALVWSGRTGCFSAGFDLKIMSGDDLDAREALVTKGGELVERIFDFPLPVVLAVTGHALALGAVFLNCADKRIGETGDFKLGLNETAIGMVLPVYAIEPALWRLPKVSQFESIVASYIHDPESAVAAGFLDEVVMEGAAVDRALLHADRFSALPTEAFSANKRAVRAATLERMRRL